MWHSMDRERLGAGPFGPHLDLSQASHVTVPVINVSRLVRFAISEVPPRPAVKRPSWGQRMTVRSVGPIQAGVVLAVLEVSWSGSARFIGFGE